MKITHHASRFTFALYLLSSFLASPRARAQLQFIDLTTLTTNTTVASASITIPGVCTNAQYFVTNTSNVIIGDPLATAFSKVNSAFSYCTNQFALLLALPNQINTNWQTYSVGLSNLVWSLEVTNGQFIAAANLVSNNFISASNILSRFLATNVPAASLPDLHDVGGKVGIGQVSPAWKLDVRGPANIAGPSSKNVGLVIDNDGVGTVLETVYTNGVATPCQAALSSGSGFFRSIGGGVLYFDGSQAKIARDGTSQQFLVNGAGGMDIFDASGGGAHLDGSGNFFNDGTFSSDGDAFATDGSGNVACVRLTAAGGTLYPGNTWNLAAITNQMPNFSFWVGNSNGLALVSVYSSNGAAWIKRLAP